MPTTTNMTLTGGLTLGTALTAANGGTGITSLGTGVATALGIATNNASGGLATETDSTFTPTLAFGGASVGIVYVSRAGYYSRVGNIIVFTIQISLSDKGSSTGNVTITGMPVAARTGMSAQEFLARTENITFTSNVSPQLVAGSTSLQILQFPSGGAASSLTDTAFTNTSNIIITGAYLV